MIYLFISYSLGVIVGAVICSALVARVRINNSVNQVKKEINKAKGEAKVIEPESELSIALDKNKGEVIDFL